MENVKYIPGDLVKIKNSTNPFIKDDTITKVVEVDSHGFIKVIILNSGSNLDYQIYTRNVVLIHLTPEILEKNGWSKNEYEVYFKFFNSKMVVSLVERSDDSWNVIVSGTTLIYCKFIHELQHLLFGLGLNSEIKV